MKPNLWGFPLRYLIGANRVVAEPHVFTMVPWMEAAEGVGLIGGYCNLFDEEDSGDFGPYLRKGHTAAEWHEGQIDPAGPGWEANLDEQFVVRRRQFIRIVELDNSDSYDWPAVKSAYDYAYSSGLHVIAKNPCLCEDPELMVRHPACVGVITEANCGSPIEVRDLLRRARIDLMPHWYVTDAAHKGWADHMARQIVGNGMKGAGVTYSTMSGEWQYNDAVVVLDPVV